MFGAYLLRIKAVTSAELEEALEAQRFKPARIGRILRDLGHLSPEDLNRYLEGYLEPRLVKPILELERELAELKVRPECLAFARRKRVLAWSETDQKITFLGAAFSDEILESAEREFQKPTSLLIVSREAFLYLWNCGQGGEKRAADVTPVKQDQPRQQSTRESVYGSLFRDLLDQAHREGASDLHVQPEADGVQIRLRIHGELETVKRLTLEHRQGFLNEVKRSCGFSIGASGIPQDRRLSLPARSVDLRANLTPTQYGERIVLRLLDHSESFKLDESGLEPAVTAELRNALRMKNGVLVVSGPTGSGKTKLLYRLLSDINRGTKNIVTLEDPIEYRIPGLSQTEVSSKVSFAQALRSFLRQDPDVILVGEVRDAETADLCVQAALTGHLVLASLHANSASEVASRFLSLGAERERLTACLRFAAAQRLLPKLCVHCSKEAPKNVREQVLAYCEQKKTELSSKATFRARNAGGCERCRGGVSGRTPILEYLRGEALRASIRGEACGDSLVTLRDAALRQAEKGVVDVLEALEIE